MKTAFYTFLTIAAFAVICGFMIVEFTDEFDFAPKAYEAPYPETLPAGCCLMTDGKLFEVRQQEKEWGVVRHVFLSGKEETEDQAIYWAWRMREHRRQARNERPDPKSERSMRPVYPELCNPRIQ